MTYIFFNSFRECFAYFGIRLRNRRRVPWAAEDAQGRVVVTTWEDCFDDNKTSYSIFGHEVNLWRSEPKAHHRTELLKSVGVGGTFNTIILRAVDSGTYPRTAVRKMYIGPTVRLTALDEETGEFSAEVVQP